MFPSLTLLAAHCIVAYLSINPHSSFSLPFITHTTQQTENSILVATIIMIHLILLTTIFVNFDTMKLAFFRGLRYLSFFNYGCVFACAALLW